MSIPADLKYTPSHEWVRVEADGTLKGTVDLGGMAGGTWTGKKAKA